MKPLSIASVESAISQFSFTGELIGYKLIHSGHINDTLDVLTHNEHYHRYVLQRLNTEVFQNPYQVMENIESVTEYLDQKVLERGGDPKKEVVHVVPTKDDKLFYLNEDRAFFRAYRYIDGKAYDSATPALFEQAGVAFGRFQKDLSDFPVDDLFVTIPMFHNTKRRYRTFLSVLKVDPVGRAKTCLDEIAFVKDHQDLAHAYEDAHMPLRVTHNDTKLNNVMLDEKTGKPLCVLDLDTVMPGLAVNDFGDAIRFGASSAAENETDLSKVHFEKDMFKAYAKGFLSEVGSSLTQEEVDHLAVSALVMTYECGMRFLTDYLQGDTYFHIDHPSENLDRARNQFALLKEMIASLDEMKAIIAKQMGR